MLPKIMVTDLDNTLLRTDKTISAFTLDVLDRCRKKGMGLVIATSRSLDASRRIIGLLRPDGAITCGGAKVVWQGRTIRERLLSAETVRALLSAYQAEEGHGEGSVQTDHGYFWNSRRPPDHPDYAGAIVTDFADFFSPAYKVTVELPEDAYERMRARFPQVKSVSYVGERWRSFMAPGVDKGTGLAELCQAAGIGLADVLAFGDDENDLPLLKRAGEGVAVGNAIDEVRKNVRQITLKCDEDGVAMYLLKKI